MRNVRLVLAYDGTEFHGWQRQKDKRTVQQTVEESLAAMTGHPVRLVASGRTDAGVHALGQVVNFRTSTSIPLRAFSLGLNAKLPDDVCVRAADDVPEEFHANRDAVRKRYRYVIHHGPIPDLFQRRYCHHSRYDLDAALMAEAATAFVGTHDFHSFETQWPNRATSVRTITDLTVEASGDRITIEVEANGFLYNMVRAIAGTLMEIGRGYWPVAAAAEILDAEDRRLAGPTAPAKGLFLQHVTYPDAL